MTVEYSVDVCKELEDRFRAAEVHRPMRINRFDPGDELTYTVTGLEQTNTARVHLVIEKFVGGGFAGQVYKVRVLDIAGPGLWHGLPARGNTAKPVPSTSSGQALSGAEGMAVPPINGLEAGGLYAMKILIPPTGFSRIFRNVLYRSGVQGPFQLQGNPTAARAGALWQKFIRRGARLRFGDEKTVVDIYGTFVDDKLGSCGELSEWIEGRTWRLEVDDRMDLIHSRLTIDELKSKTCNRNLSPGESQIKFGSPEYRAKRRFMSEFVKLLHDMGGHEFARQYEWSTCKSQPNCLKRKGTDDDPDKGLVAVDFRAGLALLPFLPMSPGDFKLIIKGLLRGSLVQFDRGSPRKLERFVQEHSDEFSDMTAMLDELKAAEQVYRDSVPDITHNHIHLLFSRRLWSTMLNSAVTGWRVRNLIDDEHERKLRKSKLLTLVFSVIGLIPFIGGFLRRLWGRADWRRHYAAMLTGGYLRRVLRAGIAEKVILWHRAGRLSGDMALKTTAEPWRFWCHFPLSILPAGLHRFLTDRRFRKEKLIYIFVRPFKLYFNRQLREQWLRDMVAEGQKKHMLSDDDAQTILTQINEPYIQKYLISMVVHLLTLPVTQIVSVAVAGIYYLLHRGAPNAFAKGLGIIVAFQLVPISPGSLVRGLYVLALVIKDRDFRDYSIAAILAFFKYIGYLAFPIQMTYHYPAMARFMAGHWATEAVHIVPVFGERGALLEHWGFCLFYNWPLTIRRRMLKRAELRASIKPRYWHLGVCAAATTAIFSLVDYYYLTGIGRLPGLKDIWWLVILAPVVCGAGITLGAGGTVLWKRIASATVCGLVAALLCTIVSAILDSPGSIAIISVITRFAWRAFIFSIWSTIGAIVTELKLPEPVFDRV